VNGVAAVVLGVLAIAIALRDIFETLFHPGWPGSLSGAIHRLIWRVMRQLARGRQRRLVLAGPLMLASLSAWAMLLATGWAAFIWPRLPEGLLLASGLDPDEQSGFLDALYVSLVTLATLGYGDITPRDDWLRLVLPLEALVGFALMTAAISWILSVPRILRQRRTLAREATLLAEELAALDSPQRLAVTDALGQRLTSLARDIVEVQCGLIQYPVTYYFSDRDPRFSRVHALSNAYAMATDLSREEQPASVRFSARMLQSAIEDLSRVLAAHYLGESEDDAADHVLAALAEDHLLRLDAHVRFGDERRGVSPIGQAR
jgi:hypothetical protein